MLQSIQQRPLHKNTVYIFNSLLKVPKLHSINCVDKSSDSYDTVSEELCMTGYILKTEFSSSQNSTHKQSVSI